MSSLQALRIIARRIKCALTTHLPETTMGETDGVLVATLRCLRCDLQLEMHVSSREPTAMDMQRVRLSAEAESRKN